MDRRSFHIAGQSLTPTPSADCELTRRRQEGREVACEAASAATSVNSGNHEKRLLPSWPAAVLSPVTA